MVLTGATDGRLEGPAVPEVKPVNKIAAYILAFCTFGAAMLHYGDARGGAPKLGENFTYYKKTQVQWGAMTLPLAAQLNYEAALYEIKAGNRDKAAVHLEEAIKLNPRYADAYLTLSRVKFRSLDPDALYYLVEGFRTMFGNFSSQSLLVVNAALYAVLLLVFVASIVFFSLALRYLPFLAHRISELLNTRFRAAFPRLSAYLVILVPFALLPGFVYGACLLILVTWYFMHRREKFAVIALVAPFILLGLLTDKIQQINPLADPGSFTNLAARASDSPGNTALIKAIENRTIPGLEAEKHNALGLLYLRQENYDDAAAHFLSAIERNGGNIMGYVNLGNVYYLQEMYEKALEGYRKAAQINDDDAVGQYNLAQAYIKTLLMAESSTALKKASAGGIDEIKLSYAEVVRPGVQVYPKTFSNRDLWRIASIESQGQEGNFLADVLRPITRTSAGSSALLLAAALLAAVILSRVFKDRHLSFQCSNCGELTCEGCCTHTGASYLCPACAQVIQGVSSDKVIEALLRQRRQAVIVKRRKTIRVLTAWVPGVRDVYYGRLTRGVALALLFSASVVFLWTKGFIVKDWNSLVTAVPLWKWIIPIAGTTLTYVLSFFSKQYYEVRNYGTPGIRQRRKETGKEDEFTINKASA